MEIMNLKCTLMMQIVLKGSINSDDKLFKVIIIITLRGEYQASMELHHKNFTLLEYYWT
jgi:hypothetical protein